MLSPWCCECGWDLNAPSLGLHFAHWGLGAGLCRVLPCVGRALGLALPGGLGGQFAERGDVVWVQMCIRC